MQLRPISFRSTDMLRKNNKNTSRRRRSSDGHFVIVASRSDARFVTAMVRAAAGELKAARVEAGQGGSVPGG